MNPWERWPLAGIVPVAAKPLVISLPTRTPKYRSKNRVEPRLTPPDNASMNDFERVAQIIRYLDAHREEQPSLADLSKASGLSPSHLHRLFSRWAGVTPKDFLQCLTLEHARELLHQGNTVLDAAFESGLSSPGRLHDLCVSLDAATPGEIKHGGEGWTLHAGLARSPFGWCCIAESPRGICQLVFLESPDETAAAADLAERWPRACVAWDNTAAQHLADRVFRTPSPTANPPPLRAFVRGSAFQIRIWRALIALPPGVLITYRNLAKAADSPRAARATGTALGLNPIAFLIPCHRVIRTTGALGGYRWGEGRKRLIIAWESSRSSPRGTSPER